MSISSERVKKWRESNKRRMVKAFGGGCCICGYSKCYRALVFHHLDPSKKDFSFGSVIGNPKAWSKIVDEMRKCVLVCHNCHMEIHDNLITIPLNVARFNEKYIDYKKQEKIDDGLMDKCPVCSGFKPTSYITCSKICAGKRTHKFDWTNIDLKERLKTESVRGIAESLGVSDMAVRKRMKKLNIVLDNLK